MLCKTFQLDVVHLFIYSLDFLACGDISEKIPLQEMAMILLTTFPSVWTEKGILKSGRKEIEHTEEILALLDSVVILKEVAIVPCQGHQNIDS